MGFYEVLSLDMFQTLVDVNKRIPQIWQGILSAEYSEEKARRGAKAIFDCFPNAYEQALNSHFLTMEEVYNICAKEVVKQTGLSVNTQDLAYNLMLQHGYAPFYEDVLQSLAKLKDNYRIIICSDSNHLMVDPLLKVIDFDEAFISDDMGCYKGELEGRFFKKVLSKIGTAKEKIIHIGDSTADVTGAHSAGITSCWINREHREWENEVQPDYIIESFSELIKILT